MQNTSLFSRLFISAVAISALSSCGDKDMYDPNYVEETRAQQYEAAFISKFGEIPSSQSWDFYAQAMQEASSKTSASDAVTIESISQPSDMDFTKWQTLLKSGVDNRDKGTMEYSLCSPGNGKFFVYAVWYAGWYETYSKYNFEFGLTVDGVDKKIFDGAKNDGQPVNDPTGAAFSSNPGYGASMYIPSGTEFSFYIKFTRDGQNYVYRSTDEGCSTLLYTYNGSNEQIIVVGFEDQGGSVPDLNDVILYIQGNPDLPIIQSKRFMCEDLGDIGDFDFNDVVFSVQPLTSRKLRVTLEAAGGTIPANLYVAGQDLGEVHELFGVGTSTMVNTGSGETKSPVTKDVEISSNINMSAFKDVKVRITPSSGDPYDIAVGETGKSPSVVATTLSTKWMKEKVSIKEGYPDFFSASWWKNAVSSKLYGE